MNKKRKAPVNEDRCFSITKKNTYELQMYKLFFNINTSIEKILKKIFIHIKYSWI